MWLQFTKRNRLMEKATRESASNTVWFRGLTGSTSCTHYECCARILQSCNKEILIMQNITYAAKPPNYGECADESGVAIRLIESSAELPRIKPTLHWWYAEHNSLAWHRHRAIGNVWQFNCNKPPLWHPLVGSFHAATLQRADHQENFIFAISCDETCKLHI